MSGTLNTGWPLDAPGADGRLRFATGPDALREALWNLLMTSPGERLMQPAFGAGLATRIGQPNTPDHPAAHRQRDRQDHRRVRGTGERHRCRGHAGPA